MIHLRRLLAGLMALLLTACVPSLSPLYTDKDLVFDPGLVGTWSQQGEGRDTWEFQKNGETSYTLIVTAENVPAQFEAHLLQLGSHRYLDLYPADPGFGLERGGKQKPAVLMSKVDNDFYRFHWLSVHTFYRVAVEGDTFHLSSLNAKWFGRMVEKRKIRMVRELEKDRFLLTGSTQELQEMVLRYADDPEAFSPGNDDGLQLELHQRTPAK